MLPPAPEQDHTMLGMEWGKGKKKHHEISLPFLTFSNVSFPSLAIFLAAADFSLFQSSHKITLASFWFLGLDDLSIDVNRVLKFPTIIALLSISPLMSVNICFLYRFEIGKKFLNKMRFLKVLFI